MPAKRGELLRASQRHVQKPRPPFAKSLRKRPASVAEHCGKSLPGGIQARSLWRRSDAKRKREYEIIRDLRGRRDAPVDSLGTEVLGDSSASKQVYAFQVLTAVFLSSQTRDEATAAAVERLKRGLRGGLSAESVRQARESTLARLMKPVAFYNIKAQNIKSIARKIVDDYGGEVPTGAEDLCKLPGIGPKMAHIAVNVITGKPQGIGVDVHVHRICNQLGWVRSREPEETRVQLEKWLPYSEWSNVNLLMVGLGQQLQHARARLLRRCFEIAQPAEAIRLLARLGLDLAVRERETGQGALHWAASLGDVEAVRLLLKQLSPHRDAAGRWPWDLASSASTAKLFKGMQAEK